MLAILLAAAAAAAVATPAAKAPGPAHAHGATKAEIQALNDRFGAAVKAGDAAAIGGMYAEDAALLPPGAPRMDGRKAIAGYWGAATKQIAEARLTTGEVRPLGDDYTRELGTFNIKTKGSPPQTLTGKYVVIWKHEGASWKLWTDAWNSDK